MSNNVYNGIEVVKSGRKWEKMFFGSYEHNLDSKGRLFVPSRFRDELGEQIYITKGFDGCLALYSEEAFKPKIEEYKSLSFNHADTRAHLRVNSSTFDKVSVDSHGRIAIPMRLLKRENITQEVTIVGVIDHLEIWDRERWNEYFDRNYGRDEEIAESLEERKSGQE